MAVTFILGRAGTGKTRVCLDGVLKDLAKPHETRPLIFLTPEQATFQTERALALRSPKLGYTRVSVVGFSHLVQRVLAETGGGPVLLSRRARAMALRAVAARGDHDLQLFRNAVKTHGFFVQLDQLIEEFLQRGVTPEALAGAAMKLEEGPTRRRTEEVAKLYADYRKWLGPQRIDPALQLAVLRMHLEMVPWLPESLVWVDGFAGFTGEELATLITLAQRARHVSVALLLDPASATIRDPKQPLDALDLFYATEMTYRQLLQQFAASGVEVTEPVILQPPQPPRFKNAPGLARLEAGMALPLNAPPESVNLPPLRGAPRDVTIVECVTHRDELRQIARTIRQRIAESNGTLNFRDFALIARKLDPFAQTVADVFAEYEIPYFLDRRRPMRAHPLSRFIRALFEAVTGDFSVLGMTRLVRSGLLPVPRESAERLENLIVGYQVRGLELWQRADWDFRRDALLQVGEEGQVLGADGQPKITAPFSLDRELNAQRRKIVAALEPLVQLAKAEPPPTGAQWAQTLHKTLEALGVRPRLEAWSGEAAQRGDWEAARTHQQTWQEFCDILQDLHDVLIDTKLAADDAAAVLNSAFSEMTVGLTPPTLNQVLVGAIERSRHPDIKFVWVFGFNEGVFPARATEDRLFSTTDRAALNEAGLDQVASHRDDAFAERMLAYIAFTRPMQHLTISYARVDDAGEPLPPSPLLEEVRSWLPGLRVQRADEDAPPTCLGELARGVVDRCGQGVPVSRAGQRFQHLHEQMAAQPEQKTRLDWLLRGLKYDNQPAPVGNYRLPKDAVLEATEQGRPVRVKADKASADSEVVWDGSPSEIERYLQCPFQHFSYYGLRLKPHRAGLPLAWDLGSRAHEVLADVTRRAMREPNGVRKIEDTRWQALLEEALENFRKRLPDDLRQRRPQLAFFSEVLGDFLREVVLAHADRWRRGQFEPWRCEYAFDATGKPDAMPPLEFELKRGRRVRLRGRIDRVDLCRTKDGEWLMVYDYKTSAYPIKDIFLTRDRLQLFLYLSALRQGLAKHKKMRPGGALLAPLQPATWMLENDYVVEAPAREQQMYLYRPRGLFAADTAEWLDEHLDKNGTPSPVAHMRLLKKDGGLAANSDAVPAAQIEARMELARRTVLFAADGITAGRIEVAPLVEKKTLACRFCEYASVCRVDRAFNVPRLAERTLPVLMEIAEAGIEEGG